MDIVLVHRHIFLFQYVYTNMLVFLSKIVNAHNGGLRLQSNIEHDNIFKWFNL